MNFELKKETLINLSDDAEVISKDMTPQIGGGNDSGYACLSINFEKTSCRDFCEQY